MSENDLNTKYSQFLSNDLNNSLNELKQIDFKYLEKAFEIKEKLFECFNNLHSENTINEIEEKNKEKLIETFKYELRKIYTVFFSRYCESIFSDEQLKSFIKKHISDFGYENEDGKYSKEIEDIPNIDHDIRVLLSNYIFNYFDKDEIVSIFNTQKNDDENKSFDGNKMCESAKHIVDEIFFKIILNKVEDILNNEVKAMFDKMVADNEIEQNDEIITKLKIDIANGFIQYKKKDLNRIVEGFFKGTDYWNNFQNLCFLLDILYVLECSDTNIYQDFGDYISEFVNNNLESNNKLPNGLSDTIKIATRDLMSDDEEYLADDISTFLTPVIGSQPNLSDLDINDIEQLNDGIKNRSKSFFSFVRPDRYLSVPNLFNFLDDLHNNDSKTEVFNKIYDEHREEMFNNLKNGFFSKVRASYVSNNKKILDISDEKKEEIISKLTQQYPNATKHIISGFFNGKKWREYKEGFVKDKSETFINKLKQSFGNNESVFYNYSFEQLIYVLSISLHILSFYVDNVSNNFYEEIEKEIALQARESEKANLKKKGLKEEQRILEQQAQEHKKALANAKKIEQATEIHNVINKFEKELDDDLLSELKKYFGGEINKKVLKCLRITLNNNGGEYKKNWFAVLGITDDRFFEIIDQYGFFAASTSIELNKNLSTKNIDTSDLSKVSEQQTETPEIVELKRIIGQIEGKEDFKEKVDLYIDAFRIFYEIDDSNEFKNQLFIGCRGDRRIIKGIEAILQKILKGQREVLKTSKSREGKYFTIDLCYNTGYRIVIQEQPNISKRVIVALVSHDEYEKNIDSYCI